MTKKSFNIICDIQKCSRECYIEIAMCTMIHTALSVRGDAVRLAVLLEAQLQLMQVHWSRVDPGALQVHPDALTPLPPNEDSYFFFFFKERKDIEGYIIEH